MIERGQHLRFALKSRETVGILCECTREDLYRDVAAEPGIAAAVDFPHAARSEEADNFVRPDAPGYVAGSLICRGRHRFLNSISGGKYKVRPRIQYQPRLLARSWALMTLPDRRTASGNEAFGHP